LPKTGALKLTAGGEGLKSVDDTVSCRGRPCMSASRDDRTELPVETDLSAADEPSSPTRQGEWIDTDRLRRGEIRMETRRNLQRASARSVEEPPNAAPAFTPT
jgi:hypothetical protein